MEAVFKSISSISFIQAEWSNFFPESSAYLAEYSYNCKHIQTDGNSADRKTVSGSAVFYLTASSLNHRKLPRTPVTSEK